MARHDQRPDPRSMVCQNCEWGCHEKCVNITLVRLGRNSVCECKKAECVGEPASQQVADPFDGSVHAPGLTVTQEGEVIFHAERG